MLQKLIRFQFYVLFFLTPLLFCLGSSELFELPKMYFVYAVTSLALGLHFASHFYLGTSLVSKSRISLFLTIFILFQIISYFFSFDRYTSLYGYYGRFNGGLLSLLAYFALFQISSIHLTSSSRNHLLTALLLGGVPVAIYGFLEHFGIDKSMWQQDVMSRVFSTFGQPNWLSAYLCILLPLTLSRIQLTSPTFKNYVYIFYFILQLVVLMFTKSQSGIIASLLSLAVVLLLTRKLKTLLAFALCSIAVLTIANPLRDKIFPPPISNLTVSDPTLNITASSDIRKVVWKGSLELFSRYPLFGTGPETFGQSYYWVRPREHNDTSEWNFLYNKAHNEYLNYLATTGAFGLVSYLIFILYSAYLAYKSKQYFLVSALISIWATNLFGFSVVFVNLCLFVLPVLALPTPANPLFQKNKPKSKFLTLLCIAASLVLVYKPCKFFLADIAYANTKSYFESGNVEQSATNATYLRVLDNQNPVFNMQAALSFASLAAAKQDTTLAKEASDLAIQSLLVSPADINLYKLQSQVYLILGTLDPNYYKYAVTALQKATILAPTDAASFYQLATLLSSLSESALAEKYYSKAVQLKPNYDLAWYDLGTLYIEQKMYSKAIESFESVLKINPNNSQAKTELAKIKSLISH